MAEDESDALRGFTGSNPNWVSSIVASIELLRFARRVGRRESLEIAEDILARIDLVPLDASVAAKASELSPPLLRSRDAIHLASAFELGEELGPFITYDRRLSEAAAAAKLQVLAPS